MTDNAVPLAHRLHTSPWRDRRVIIGMVLVLLSTVAGAALLVSARDTTTYWVLDTDVRAGDEVSREHVRPIEVRVPENVGKTLVPLESAPRSGQWVHDVAKGSLVTREAITDGVKQAQHLPIALSPGAGPPDLSAGDRVNIWVGPGGDKDAGGDATRILTEVTVVDVHEDVTGTGSTLLIDVGVDGPTADVVAAVSSRHITVVRVR